MYITDKKLLLGEHNHFTNGCETTVENSEIVGSRWYNKEAFTQFFMNYAEKNTVK